METERIVFLREESKGERWAPFRELLAECLDEIESLQEKLSDAKHGIELADSEIVGWRQERDDLKAEAVRTTAQLEKLDEAGHTAITDWPKGSKPQYGDGLDRLLDLPGELEKLQAVVEKQPKTADGVPIMLHDKVWIRAHTNNELSHCEVDTIHSDGMIGVIVGYGLWGRFAKDCFSTREAAEAKENDH